MENLESVVRYFPSNIQKMIVEYIELVNEIEEIRIRVGKKVILRARNYESILEYIVTNTDMMHILEKITQNSIYAYREQITNGYITVKGGHRIGIVGSCVIENNKVTNVKNITSMNIRIANEIHGAAEKILDQIINMRQNQIYNTLIVSPPGKGKTTILRDLIRNLSTGVERYNYMGQTIGVVDERGEIAATYQGIAQNDLGQRTDVIENVSKARGIEILIRSMAPQIIACDEISSKEDIEAIQRAFASGVKGIFTMHGNSIEDVRKNKHINELIENKTIEKLFFI